MTASFDVVIGGAGPVGVALACALQDSGLRILLIEPRAQDPTPGDPRAIAISYGSRMLLEQLGAWSGLAAATPINTIHVSQRGRFGTTQLTDRECGLPALGYVARYDDLRQALAAAVRLHAKNGESQVHDAVARIVKVDQQDDHVAITYQSAIAQPERVDAKLLVIADGGGNVGEFLAGTVSESFDYYQIAVLATVHATHLRAGFAFERFTPEGPIALLPFEDGMALVWTTTQERAHALLPMPEQEFLDELQRHFGDRLGKFTRAGRRSVFPLSRRQVRVDAQRVALIGNAAQTLHPVAGQGFNLGLRDAWELAQLIKQRSEDAAAALKHYAAQRARDRRSAIGFTDSLICAFSNNRPLLGLARGSGLAMLDFVAPLRRSFARRMAFGIRSGQ